MTSGYLDRTPRRMAFLDTLWPSGDVRVEVSGKPGYFIVKTDAEALRVARRLAGDNVVIARGLRKGARR